MCATPSIGDGVAPSFTITILLRMCLFYIISILILIMVSIHL